MPSGDIYILPIRLIAELPNLLLIVTSGIEQKIFISSIKKQKTKNKQPNPNQPENNP